MLTPHEASTIFLRVREKELPPDEEVVNLAFEASKHSLGQAGLAEEVRKKALEAEEHSRDALLAVIHSQKQRGIEVKRALDLWRGHRNLVKAAAEASPVRSRTAQEEVNSALARIDHSISQLERQSPNARVPVDVGFANIAVDAARRRVRELLGEKHFFDYQRDYGDALAKLKKYMGGPV